MFYDENRVKNMPRKTLALISGLVLVTVVLFIIALKTNNKQAVPVPTPSPAQPTQPMEAVAPAHAVLALSPNQVNVSPGQVGSVDLMLDAQEHPVTAVQLQLKYDPAVISNVKVSPGPMFQNPGLLVGKDDPAAGAYRYMIGIGPNQATLQGTGVVAKITFNVKRGATKETTLEVTPESIVTARGVATSVLGSYTGATVTIGGSGQ